MDARKAVLIIKTSIRFFLFKLFGLLYHLKKFLPKKKCNKVFIIGDIYSVSGLGNTVRALIKSLEGSFDFYLVNLPLSSKSYQGFEDLKKYEVSCIGAGINIFVGSPTILARSLLRRDFINVLSNYSIGIWFWELPSIPKEWIGLNKLIDEVWVQTEFTKSIFESKSNKIKLMPFALINRNRNLYNRKDFFISEDVFMFTLTFDYLSKIERKNPVATIRAFQDEFGNDCRVLLFVKTLNKTKVSFKQDQLDDLIGQSENIKVVDECFSDDEISGLIDISDCYVSLHRSEGLGLAMAEAMSLGTLVLATGYSGNTTYMNEKNSLVVQYNLTPVKQGHYSGYKNNYWAEPSLEDARIKMRFAFENRDATKCLIMQAKLDIEKYANGSQKNWVIQELLKHIN